MVLIWLGVCRVSVAGLASGELGGFSLFFRDMDCYLRCRMLLWVLEIKILAKLLMRWKAFHQGLVPGYSKEERKGS